MYNANVKCVAYICDKQTMDCAGAKGCGKSCFHTICEECAANKDSAKLAKDFFNTFNVTVIVKPTAEKQEDLFEVWLEEKRHRPEEKEPVASIYGDTCTIDLYGDGDLVIKKKEGDASERR